MAASLVPHGEGGLSGTSYGDLSGASVFITGGGAGIGAALTKGFLDQGAQVAFIGRSDRAAFVDAMAAATGCRPLFLQGDVTDPARLRAAIDDAEAAHGPLDVLVTNAADDRRVAALEVGPDDWDAQMAINLDHYFFACQRAAESMAGRGGRIVNLSSIVPQMGAEGLAPYVTANAGVVGMTRSLAREWGSRGIRVNAVAPGMVLTEKQREMWISEDAAAAFRRTRQSLDRPLRPEDIVGPVLFLASEASAAVTGQCLIADAGVVYGA